MMRTAKKIVLILFFGMLVAGNCLATTYYVDYSSGSDSNNGTSKTSPWQHAPGMQNCTNLCSSASIKAGDSIILKGGVSWPNASFMWSLPSGTSGNPVYVGVDKTWYAGGAWTRPIMNPGKALIPNNADTMFNVGGWVTFDNIEVTGFYWDSTCLSAPFGECGFFNVGQHDGFVLENSYFHGWTHAGNSSSTSSGVVNIWAGNGGPNCSAHDNVVVGTDVAGDHSVNAFFAGPVLAYNNYIRQVSSGFIVTTDGIGPATYHDNWIQDVGPAYCNVPTSGFCTHENGFEDNADAGIYFYNNVITGESDGLALWIAPEPNHTATMWNNVIYNIHNNQVLDMAPPVYNPSFCSSGKTSNGYCNTAGTYIFQNNTVECGDDSAQYDGCQSNIGVIGSGSTATSFIYQNNHFISASTASGCYKGSGAASSCTFDTSNVVQTLSTANSQGYNSSEPYAFSPSASGNATVGAGSNLMSAATGNLASLASDTTYSCTMGSGTEASCPAETPAPRPSSGSWDAGAYLYSSSSQKPAPPSGLAAQVN
jgi:hypothetical protein